MPIQLKTKQHGSLLTTRQVVGRGILRRRLRHLSGVTLIEALMAMTLIAMAGSVLLSATQSSMGSTEQALDEAIAFGIAKQLVDEAMRLPYFSKAYTATDPNNVFAAPLGNSNASGRRDTWDDSDDFAGPAGTTFYSNQPACDRWGQKLGQGASAANGSYTDLRHANCRVRSDFFDSWLIETDVYYLNPTDLTQTQTANSYYRALEVRVYRKQPSSTTKTLLAKLRRVHCHVPK